MSSLAKLLTKLAVSKPVIGPAYLGIAQVRFTRAADKFNHLDKPKPGYGQTQYRRTVHFPEDGKYTVKPLLNTHLAGRDPVSGRKIAEGIGGGLKHKYHWIKWERDGPSGEGEAKIEKVMEIIKCGCRTANVAIVATGDEVKYILATEHMKPGDLIKTSKFIPRIPVRAKDGDAYPLGALPVGTLVNCVQLNPESNFSIIHAAGTYGTILRKFDDRVVVQIPNKKEYGLLNTCMATVGRLSNVEHGKTHIGSPQKLRELGFRPRSGLWHRKTGKHGRKIRRLPPMKLIGGPRKAETKFLKFTLKV